MNGLFYELRIVCYVHTESYVLKSADNLKYNAN